MILQHLDSLLLALQRPAWRDATGEAWLGRLVSDLDGVRVRMAQPFTLLVLGDFKRGKSTLVNALIGRNVVGMDVAPETVAVTEIREGTTLRAEARLADGGIVELREEELSSAGLLPIVDNLPAPIDVIRIEAPISLLDDVVLVDTPGTGDLLWRFDERVRQYLPTADAVLHVTSAISPMSDTEREFLRLSLLPLELAKLVFVVNQIDLVRSSADARRVVNRITDTLAPSFPDSPVVAVSALQELTRRTGEMSPNPERADDLDRAFDGLRDLLDRRVLLHRGVVRTERAAYEAERVLRRASSDLAHLRASLESDRSALQSMFAQSADSQSRARTAIAESEQRIRSAIGAMAEEAAVWVGGLMTRLESEAVPQLEALNHEDVQRHFAFFLAEVLRDAVSACMGAHQGEVLALADDVTKEAAQALVATFDAETGHGVKSAADRAAYYVPSWTLFDHLNLVALTVSALTLGAGAFVAMFTGLFDRSHGHAARAVQFREAVQAALPQVRSDVQRAVSQAYDALADQVCASIRARQEEELARMEAQLGHALAVHKQGEEHIQQVSARLESVIQRLEATIDEFRVLRDQLRAVAGS